MSMANDAFIWAQGFSDFSQEFQVGNHRLVLARYKNVPHQKRSCYSLFIFMDNDPLASRSYSYEPDDPDDYQVLLQQLEEETDPELKALLQLEVEEFEANPLISPIAFFGELFMDSRVNHGKAPNELTIDQFRPIAFEWAASILEINVSDIVQNGALNDPITNKKKWWHFWK